MMTYNSVLADRVANYVQKLYKSNQTPELVYHNLAHTKKVVRKIKEISAHFSLDEEDLFTLSSAAWFHDCGHLFSPAKDHEVKSVLLMRTFMRELKVEEYIIEEIQQCILATRLPNSPATLLAEILCDADLYHLGTREFFITDSLVKKEFELRNGFTPSDWEANTLSFLERHVYFTDYCRVLLQKGKQKNIALVRKMIIDKS